jgi:hypothetical protein
MGVKYNLASQRGTVVALGIAEGDDMDFTPVIYFSFTYAN